MLSPTDRILVSDALLETPLGRELRLHADADVSDSLEVDVLLPNGMGVVYWSEEDCVATDDVRLALAPFQSLSSGLFMFESTAVSNIYFPPIRDTIVRECCSVQVIRVNCIVQAREILHSMAKTR
eukprot:CFRG5599T1